MRICKKGIAFILTMALMLGGIVFVPTESEAAKKPKLSQKKVSIQAGKSKTIKVVKAKGWKLTWKSKSKKVAKVSKKGKYSAKIRAVKKGKTTVSCRVKKGKKKYTLKCAVSVYNKKATASPTPRTSAKPSSPSTPTDNKPQNSPPAEDKLISDSILENYRNIFPNLGNCVSYANPSQLQDEETLAFVKKHFNSITLENEMKPDAILSSSPTKISVEKAKELGYVIPDNYAEAKVPKLNFDKIDKVLQIAYDNGLRMRAHTLLWHSQTPEWFFVKDYSGSTKVSTSVMDARLEFYVRSVMTHVMEKEKEIAGNAGSVVYAWDVVNEYLHRFYARGLTWTSVYGDMGASPSYVKKAFEIAYDMLEQYEVQDSVTLFYNDFDTYFGVDNTIKLVEFINKDEKANICGGIGMQSHVDIKRPTIDEYSKALDAFMATGLEVQITELDFTINFDTDGSSPSYNYKNEGETIDEQAEFVGDFMTMVTKKQINRNKNVSPKGITGVTLWGLYDSISWRSKCQPLLFSTSINDPKPAFQAFLQASLSK